MPNTLEILTISRSFGEYDEGDILDVRPEGFQWGRKELEKDCFEILKIETDLPLESFRQMVQGHVVKCDLCGETIDDEEAEEHDHPEARDPETDCPTWGLEIVKARRWKADKGQGRLKCKDVESNEVVERIRNRVNVQGTVRKAGNANRRNV